MKERGRSCPSKWGLDFILFSQSKALSFSNTLAKMKKTVWFKSRIIKTLKYLLIFFSRKSAYTEKREEELRHLSHLKTHLLIPRI